MENDNYWKKTSKILYLESFFQYKSFSVFLKLKKNKYSTPEEFDSLEKEMFYWDSLRERTKSLGEKITERELNFLEKRLLIINLIKTIRTSFITS